MNGRPLRRSRRGISTVAIIVIVVVIIAAIAGAAYYFLVASTTTTTTSTAQTFTFAEESTGDPSHAVSVDALNHLSQYNLKAIFSAITDPTALTSATSQGQIDMFSFQFPTDTLNAIEKGANVIGIGEESTVFLQYLVVTSNVTTLKQLNNTVMAAFSLDGPVLFPLVWAAEGQNFSQYNVNLVVLGASPVKAQALIAGKYIGAFLDPADAATVFKTSPGKFHVLTSTAAAFPGVGAGIIFANKAWYNSHFQVAVDVLKAMLQSARNATANLQKWINSTYAANYTNFDFKIYNTTEYLYAASDYFSPNMITFTPALMNSSDYFMAGGGLINSSGDVNKIFNFSAAQAALNALGTIKEPTGPYSTYTPLSLAGLSSFGSSGVLYLFPSLTISKKR